MSEYIPIVVALIVSAPGLLAWRSSMKNSASIHNIHLSINSRMDELLDATKVASKAEGANQERASQKKK